MLISADSLRIFIDRDTAITVTAIAVVVVTLIRMWHRPR